MLFETPDFLMRHCGKTPTTFSSIKIIRINNSTLLSFSSCRITLALSFHKSVQIPPIVLATEHIQENNNNKNLVRCNESEMFVFNNIWWEQIGRKQCKYKIELHTWHVKNEYAISFSSREMLRLFSFWSINLWSWHVARWGGRSTQY